MSGHRLLLTVEAETWPIAGTFTIARGSKTQAEVVVATLRDPMTGAVGRGEAVPYGRYGETVEGVRQALQDLAPALAAGEIDRAALRLRLPAGAARNALDCALWDWQAKAQGVPVWRLAGLSGPPQPLHTAVTLSLDTPDAMAAKAATLATHPLLKVKLGGEGVLPRLEAVRAAAPAPRLIVDANEAWSLDQLRHLLPDLQRLRVDLIEQPLPAGEDAGLASLGPCPVPLCADESLHTRADLEQLRGRYQAVNIKLDKTGGLTEALDLATTARSLGFKTMVGCMVGTSLSMAPAALVAQGAAFVDLDGPLMLQRDRDGGFRYSQGEMAGTVPSIWGE